MSTGAAAFAMAYFSGQDEPDGEQIRLAVSNGPAPTRWRTPQGGRAQLVSEVGECGVRDPFLFFDHRRDLFIVIATDLRIFPDQDWDRAVRHGSHAITVFESSDLVHWTPGRLLEVAPETAGNAWAPKAFWSDADDAWAIIFASAVYDSADDRVAAQHQRLLYVTTNDFVTTSEVKVYFDPGHDVIDAAFVRDGAWWYRFSANSHGGAEDLGHHILEERARDLFAPAWAPVAVDIGKAIMRRAEGPAPFAALDERRWYLLIDDIFDQGYHLLTTVDLSSGHWTEVDGAELPPGARHGSVLAVEQRHAKALTGALAASWFSA